MSEIPLRQKLLKLAAQLIDQADNFGDRLDALKAATALYLGDSKIHGNEEDDSLKGRGMNEWRAAIKGERTDA